MCDNQEGWVDDDGSSYYYYSNGEMATGWQQLDGEWYYFYPKGSMAHGVQVDSNFLDHDGRMVTSEKWVNTEEDNSGTWYYAGSNGELVRGWNKVGKDFHYFNYPGGSMTYDNTIDGFDIDYDGKIVGGTGWLKDGYSENWYYYSDGEMKTGWIEYNNKWYYLNDDGSMATGWKYVDGDWYYFHSDGDMVTGWVEDKGIWYFLYNNGSMAHDDTFGGYHVDSQGKMVTGTGWITVDGSCYFLKDDGEVANGWLYDEGNWYYLYPGGSMAHDTTIDGWTVDDSGKWITDEDNSSNTQEDSNSKIPEFMDCDTGDKNVDAAFTRWYEDKKPQLAYAGDPRYSAMAILGFQNRLLYMAEEQSIDVNNLTTDELNKLFEYELDDQSSEILAMSGASDIIGNNVGNAVTKGAGEAGKLSLDQINELVDEIGGSIKNHPLRQEYENAVKNLCNYEAELRAQELSPKEIAEALYKARRDLGVKYKNLTPDALREYIYEVNMGRYGDELGASFDFLVNKYSSQCETMDEVYEAIIKSSQRPNSNVDKLLQNFKEWLIKKNQ